jgi:hypothetical protein
MSEGILSCQRASRGRGERKSSGPQHRPAARSGAIRVPPGCLGPWGERRPAGAASPLLASPKGAAGTPAVSPSRPRSQCSSGSTPEGCVGPHRPGVLAGGLAASRCIPEGGERGARGWGEGGGQSRPCGTPGRAGGGNPFGRALGWGLRRCTKPPHGTMHRLEARGSKGGAQSGLMVSACHPGVRVEILATAALLLREFLETVISG